MACAWRFEEGIRFHVPGCWGTVHDPDGPCYCADLPESFEDRIDRIEQQLSELLKHKGLQS